MVSSVISVFERRVYNLSEQIRDTRERERAPSHISVLGSNLKSCICLLGYGRQGWFFVCVELFSPSLRPAWSVSGRRRALRSSPQKSCGETRWGFISAERISTLININVGLKIRDCEIDCLRINLYSVLDARLHRLSLKMGFHYAFRFFFQLNFNWNWILWAKIFPRRLSGWFIISVFVSIKNRSILKTTSSQPNMSYTSVILTGFSRFSNFKRGTSICIVKNDPPFSGELFEGWLIFEWGGKWRTRHHCVYDKLRKLCGHALYPIVWRQRFLRLIRCVLILHLGL